MQDANAVAHDASCCSARVFMEHVAHHHRCHSRRGKWAGRIYARIRAHARALYACRCSISSTHTHTPTHTRTCVPSSPPPQKKMPSLPLELAADLGRLFSDVPAFEVECDQCPDVQVATELRCVARSIARLSGDDYVLYVSNEVLSHPIRRAFYLKQPFDHYIIRLRASPKHLEEAGNVYPFLLHVVDAGAPIDRVAAGLMPTIIENITSTNFLEATCHFLQRMASDTLTRPMLLCPRLMESLARRARGYHMKHVANLLLTHGDLWGDPVLLLPVLRECAGVLLCESIRIHRLQEHPHLLAGLRLLSVCASVAIGRRLLMLHVVALGRHGWPVAFGVLLSNMLTGTSVELIFHLHLRGTLQSLIRAAHSPSCRDAEAWDVVRAHLRRHWPAHVDFVMNLTDDASQIEVTSPLVCPITLQPCRDPIVASDGHTYERDALMQHLTTQRVMISPLTKQPLEYHLFTNYAGRSA